MFALLLVHAGQIPHVHPHETGVVVCVVLALIAGGALAMRRGKPTAS
ncbi:MAG: hypothetical protein ACM358_08175 [Gemmatimonadota bacterium]